MAARQQKLAFVIRSVEDHGANRHRILFVNKSDKSPARAKSSLAQALTRGNRLQQD